MSVDIAASTGSGAAVQGDSVTAQGLYYVAPHSAVINEAISAADATNPRLDQVILEVKDDTHDAGGLNIARTRVVAGTPTGGATLDNRSGAAALPSTAIRLADVLVAASDTSITNSEIRDRRPWCRGAYTRIHRMAGSNYSRSSGTLALVDSTNLQPRMECSGVPLRVSFLGNHQETVAGVFGTIGIFVDGAELSAANGQGRYYTSENVAASEAVGFALITFPIVTAGSHLIGPGFAGDGANNLTLLSTTDNLTLIVEELVQQNATNG